MITRNVRPDTSASRSAAAARTGRRRRRRDDGQALVEFAMMIPFFFVIFAGIVSFGLALYYNMGVMSAAREGARAGAMTAATSTIPAVVTSRVNAVASGNGMGSVRTTVSCVTLNATTTANPCTWTTHTNANTGGAQQGDAVRVTVSFTMANPLPLTIRLFGSNVGLPATFTLTSSVQMILDAATNA